jgi:hypothetical protein
MHINPKMSLPKLISIKYYYSYLILGHTFGILFALIVFDHLFDRAEGFLIIS